jgi:hypothetical protein
MKSKLLKIATSALLFGLSQGSNAALVKEEVGSKLVITTLNDTKATGVSFADTIGKDTPFTDNFEFQVTKGAKVTGTISAIFTNANQEFKTFGAYLFDVTKGQKVVNSDFNPIVTATKDTNGKITGYKESGSFGGKGSTSVFLSSEDVYEVVVDGKTALGSGHSYSGSISVSPVPEAEEWAMMMLGLGLVGLVAKRKKA